MTVEKFKYTIWAPDRDAATAFYVDTFGGEITRTNPAVTDVEIAGVVLTIHGGGEGKPTWTGLTFQVPDVVAGAAEVVAGGGTLDREPEEEEDGEAPHLAMCSDPSGNAFMLTRKR